MTTRQELLARAAVVMTRLNLDPDQVMSMEAGPFAGHLLLMPILERIVDRLTALETSDGRA